MLNLSDDRTFRPLQRYEQIAERLAGDIRSGALAPGERLPSERELARVLEVSRASVREAIGALQVEGVVETRPGGGGRGARAGGGDVRLGAPAGGRGAARRVSLSRARGPRAARARRRPPGRR